MERKGYGTQNSNDTNQKINTIDRTEELGIENLQSNQGKNPKRDIPKKAKGIPVSSHHQ